MAADEAAATEPLSAYDRHWLDAERIRVYPIIILVIFGVTAAWWTYRSLPGLVDPYGKPVGYDFIAFWSAAKLALAGRPAAAFDWYAIQAAHHLAVSGIGEKVFLWHYPPTYLLLVMPLGLLPYPVALVTFLATTGAMWGALLHRVLPDRRAWLPAAALPAGLVNLMHGQNGFLTAALAGFALLALDRRPIWAGILIGLLAVKPHLAVLFPLVLAAEGRWRSFVAAAVTAISFTVVSIAAFGWSTVAAFWHDLPIVHQLIDGGFLPWGMMPSPYVFALALGARSGLAMGLQIVVALVAATSVWIVWRLPRAPFEAKAAAFMAAAMLMSPYVFYYDLTFAGLAIVWLAILGLRHGFYRGEREILFAAWLAPIFMYPVEAATHVQIGFPLLVALLAFAIIRARALGARPQDERELRSANWAGRLPRSAQLS